MTPTICAFDGGAPMREEFAQEMESTWQTLTAEAARSRDPNLGTYLFCEWYRALPAEQRRLADEQLAQWIHSADTGRQCDALAVIEDFRIATARPSTEALLQRLAHRSEPQMRFLRQRLMRLLDILPHQE